MSAYGKLTSTSDEQLLKLLRGCSSIAEAQRRLGFKRDPRVLKYLSDLVKKYQLPMRRNREISLHQTLLQMPVTQLISLIEEHKTIRNVCLAVGFKAVNYRARQYIVNVAEQHGVRLEHIQGSPSSFECLNCKTATRIKPTTLNKFCGNHCQHEYAWKTKRKPLLEAGKLAPYTNRPSFIRYLTERDGYACAECGLTEWRGSSIILDVDHIDGNNDNNLPNNVRFLCPNCHRQTPTWGNKKR